MKLALPFGRIRVIDGVIVAAVALLALKAIGLFAPAEPELGPDGLPGFARVLAYARSNYLPPDPTTTGSVPDKAKPAAAAPVDVVVPAPAGSPAERAIQERLGARREELQQKARDLDAREKLLLESERKADARQDGARQDAARPGEDRGADGRPGAPGAADPDGAALKGLVTMYETMKPKEAARVFERLPQDVLVPVVRRVAPRKMAEILAAMSPESAEKLTVALARRGRAAEEERPGAAPALPAGELQAIEPAPAPAARPRTGG